MATSPVARGERTVTVSTLRVDGRAMSMAFFKQLPEAIFTSAAMDPARNTNLQWWGYVRKDAEIWLVAEVATGHLVRCNLTNISPVHPQAKLFTDTKKAVLKDTEQLFL